MGSFSIEGDPSDNVPNLLSCDLEEWFHSENLRGLVPTESWDRATARVEHLLENILDLLEDTGATGTFFVLGWIAERFPHLVRLVKERGHEIACHGSCHQLIYTQTPSEFREDLHRAKAEIEEITGIPVVGYRAPTFSITEWALDILAEEGFTYDSSVMQTSVHDRYGKVNVAAGQGPYRISEIRKGLTEIPLSSVVAGPFTIPWGGGGYFRLFPYPVYRIGVSRLRHQGEALRFYFHPWELDVDQPKVKGVGLVTGWRQRVGLRGMRSKLDRLLRQHPFAPFKSALPT